MLFDGPEVAPNTRLASSSLIRSSAVAPDGRATRYTSVPKNGRRMTQMTQSAFDTPPMSSRRKRSTSANPQSIARGRKIRKRKKFSQNVATTRLLQWRNGLIVAPRGARVSPNRDEHGKRGDRSRKNGAEGTGPLPSAPFSDAARRLPSAAATRAAPSVAQTVARPCEIRTCSTSS